jgi:hypothetical protein
VIEDAPELILVRQVRDADARVDHPDRVVAVLVESEVALVYGDRS